MCLRAEVLKKRPSRREYRTRVQKQLFKDPRETRLINCQRHALAFIALASGDISECCGSPE
jgi:hypothetical protein